MAPVISKLKLKFKKS